MGIYFHYHKDAYFIKGLCILLLPSIVQGRQRYLKECIFTIQQTLIAAVYPSLLTYTEGVVRVQTVGITRGLTVFDNTKKRYAEMTAWSGMPTVKVAVTD
ncbi:hypothetical protein EJB05_02811, partial [Eragrostis curvula]